MLQTWVESTERGSRKDCELTVSRDQLLGTRCGCAQNSLTLVAGTSSE